LEQRRSEPLRESRSTARIQMKTIVEFSRRDLVGTQRDKHEDALSACRLLNIGGGIVAAESRRH
jgi:hypothetical protein